MEVAKRQREEKARKKMAREKFKDWSENLR